MKLLLNDKEIANFLLDMLDIDSMMEKQGFKINFRETEDFIFNLNPKLLNGKNPERLKEKLQKAVRDDVSFFRKNYMQNRSILVDNYFSKIHTRIDRLIDIFGVEFLFEKYKKSDYTNFIKGTGQHLSKDLNFIRRKDFVNFEENCLIRNTVGNENLLVTKIKEKYPFWFIDSGYTNFLEPSKKWHRLVKNHLHYGDNFEAPVDRLEIFPSFPRPWRTDGEFILIIEPGPFAAQIFGIDLSTWKYDVERELKQYTDKKILFREKAPKKERTSLYQELLNEDYYCIININSNAATEAIWAGIPVITLDKHISNSVSRNKLSDVNNLYRGSLANWICVLSYSQFTKSELIDGTAKNILDQFHYV